MLTDPFVAERRASLERAGQLRALAAASKGGAERRLFVLLAESYEKLGGSPPAATHGASEKKDP
jgi:hypothetical protein